MRTPAANKPPFRQKEPDRRTLTSERIADDIKAFRSSGGRIEVLGVTRVLQKLGDPITQQEPKPVQPPRGKQR
jgi:hypothetical protein